MSQIAPTVFVDVRNTGETADAVRTIYAALLRFGTEPSAALPTARAYTRQWVSRPWGGWPKGHSGIEGSFTSDDDSIVRWRTLESDAARLWELQVEEAFPDDPSMRQATLVQVGNDAGDAFAFVQVSLRSVNDSLTGTVIFENEPPEIVPVLLSQVPCVDGGRQLSPRSWAITRAQESAFVDVMQSANRRLPVLLLLVDAAFTETDADEVATALAGLAHVASVQRDQFDAMVERSGLDLARGASAYLWWAVGSDGGHPRPQWFRGEAMAPSHWGVPAWHVVRTVFGVSAFRSSPPALAGQLEAETALRRIRALEERSGAEADHTEMLREWERDLISLERVQRQNAYLELENERIQNDFNALLVAFDTAVAGAANAVPGSDAAPDAPASLAEAVKLAAENCRALDVLPDAIRSAEAWQYARPDVVLDALAKLDKLVLAWRRDELSGSFMVAARAAGLPWRPAISRTAQTRYKDDYVRRIGDREIMLGPHLAWGNSPDNALRIYLYLDRETRTVVVGHAGRHLRDTSNPHL